jgi:glycosyltransferase involved in cell wall biosynthesis
MGHRVDIAHFSRRHLQFKQAPTVSGVIWIGPLLKDMSHPLNLLWLDLKRAQREKPYDVVVAFGGRWPLQAGPLFSKWLNSSFTLFLRGNDFDAQVFDAQRTAVLERAIHQATDIIVNTREKKERLDTMVAPSKVKVVHNGIDKTLWTATQDDHNKAKQLRASLNILPEDFVVLGVGQLKAKKGWGPFINVLARDLSNSKPVLITQGDLDQQTTEQLSKSSLRHHHIPYSHSSDVLVTHLLADAVAIPSFYDGLPNALLEAMALACPIFASNAGGMADLLTHRDNAFLFEAGDMDHAHRQWNAFRKLTIQERHDLGQSAQRDISNYTPEKECQSILDVMTAGISNH